MLLYLTIVILAMTIIVICNIACNITNFFSCPWIVIACVIGAVIIEIIIDLILAGIVCACKNS